MVMTLFAIADYDPNPLTSIFMQSWKKKASKAKKKKEQEQAREKTVKRKAQKMQTEATADKAGSGPGQTRLEQGQGRCEGGSLPDFTLHFLFRIGQLLLGLRR